MLSPHGKIGLNQEETDCDKLWTQQRPTSTLACGMQCHCACMFVFTEDKLHMCKSNGEVQGKFVYVCVLTAHQGA